MLPTDRAQVGIGGRDAQDHAGKRHQHQYKARCAHQTHVVGLKQHVLRQEQPDSEAQTPAQGTDTFFLYPLLGIGQEFRPANELKGIPTG